LLARLKRQKFETGHKWSWSENQDGRGTNTGILNNIKFMTIKK